MKEGWEKKKMSDVFDLQMGKTPDRKNLSYFGGDNIWVSISDIKDKYINSSKEHLTDSAVKETNIKEVQEGTVIMSFKLTVGRTAIAATKLYTNEAIMAFNVKDGFTIDSSFLYYYLSAYRWQGTNKAVMGLTLNKATISSQYISIPPLSVQESIVSELDMLSGIISKHKALQEEYDRLEQSIFYDMFGDPVTNEKGWEVKKLEEVADFKNGLNFEKNESGNKILFIGVSDFQDRKQISSKDVQTISITENVSDDYYLEDNDILFVRSNGSKELIGRCMLVLTDNKKITYSGFCIRGRFKKNIYNPVFLINALKTESIRFMLSHAGHGCNIANLNQKVLNSIEMPLPPLSLQQSFADKISAIEQMKAKNKAAQEEAEMLFNERMAYYF